MREEPEADVMLTKEVEVAAMDGSERREKALLVLCAHCCPEISSTFLLFYVKGHLHLQCARCDTTFCQGTCDTKPS